MFWPDNNNDKNKISDHVEISNDLVVNDQRVRRDDVGGCSLLDLKRTDIVGNEAHSKSINNNTISANNNDNDNNESNNHEKEITTEKTNNGNTSNRNIDSQTLLSFATPQQQLLSSSDKEIDEMIVRKLNEMSERERNLVFDDIHGVSSVIPETSDFINQHLYEFRSKLSQKQNNNNNELLRTKAYNLAMQQSVDFVNDPKLHLQVLRAKHFNINQAVELLNSFLETKLELFGPERLTKQITIQQDFHGDDLKCLKSGCIQLLPIRDQGGRCILFCHAKDIIHYSITSLVKVLFYIVMSMIQENSNKDAIENQRKGYVIVAYNVGGTHNPKIAFTIGKILKSIPIRSSGSHLLHDNFMMQSLVTMIKYVMTDHAKVRFRIHYGSHQECLVQIQTFGIAKSILPFQDDDDDDDNNNDTTRDKNPTLRLDRHNLWLQQQYDNEQKFIATVNTNTPHDDTTSDTTISTNSSNKVANSATLLLHQQEEEKDNDNNCNKTIQTPRYNDVLFGRGKNIHNHPGNVRFHSILQIHGTKYHRLDKFGKTALAETIVHMIHKSNGRFLKRSKDCITNLWVEVDNEEARDKVTHTFRNHKAATISRDG